MKIAVWGTKHSIARTVADAVLQGLGNKVYVYLDTDEMFCEETDVHIGYGILRGMDEVFRACQKAGKPFFHIDKGYWKPGHYDGYYRIGLNGTQQTTGLAKLEPDYERWDVLGLEILPAQTNGAHNLICPPTDAVRNFFNLLSAWTDEPYGDYSYIREKDSPAPLKNHLHKCAKVITFNSSVGWEALRQGIPVISDPNHSFIGAYQKQVDKSPLPDIDSRRRMFAVMASLQLSLSEIRSGKIWPLIQRHIELRTKP